MFQVPIYQSLGFYHAFTAENIEPSLMADAFFLLGFSANGYLVNELGTASIGILMGKIHARVRSMETRTGVQLVNWTGKPVRYTLMTGISHSFQGERNCQQTAFT